MDDAMTPKTHMAADAVNGAAAMTIVGTTVAGLSMQEWAAVIAALYSLMLVADKGWTLYQRLSAWWKTRR